MSENYKNEKFDITLTRKPDCLVEIKITATPEAAKESHAKALKNIRKEVSFPGFRKGKAPEKMVLSKYGSQIEREFKELFLNESARQAMQISKTFPWNQSEKVKADIEEASQEKGGRFTIEFEAFPTIPDVDPAKIEIEKIEPPEIDDEAIEKHIRSLQYHNAKWEEVKDRAVQDDDFVEVTIKTEGSERKGSFHVNKEHIDEWLYDFFVGKEIGQTNEATPPKPEKGESKPIAITIHKIQVPELSVLDDEFAKKFGADGMEDFRKKVKDYLQRRENEEAENRIHAAIQQKLSESFPFDIPASLKESERVNILNQLIENYKRQQYSDEEISQIKDQLEEVALQRALANVRTHYILLKTIDQQQFKVGKEEIMNELIHQSLKPDGTMDMEMVNNPEKYSSEIVRQLQMVKAMKYLAEHAKMT